MKPSDRIERTMTFHVPRELVWDAITQPESISKWFGDDTELELTPGGEAVFRWGEIEVRATVDTVEPPSRFSYRWEPSHTLLRWWQAGCEAAGPGPRPVRSASPMPGPVVGLGRRAAG